MVRLHLNQELRAKIKSWSDNHAHYFWIRKGRLGSVTNGWEPDHLVSYAQLQVELAKEITQ